MTLIYPILDEPTLLMLANHTLSDASVSLPRRAVSWSVVCLSGIFFWPYSLVFIDILAFINENLYIDRRYVVCAILLLLYTNVVFSSTFQLLLYRSEFFMVLYNSNI